MKSAAVDLLVELTDQLYKEEIARVREEMHASPTHTFDLGRNCVLLVFILLFRHRYFLMKSFVLVLIFSHGRTA
jgi:hypothetical protein